MDTSFTSPDTAYPAFPVNNLSSSSPFSSSERPRASSPGRGQHTVNRAPGHDADAYGDDRHCSTSFQAELETAGIEMSGIYENGGAGLDHLIIERMPSQDDQGRQNGRRTVDNVDSSDFSADVEHGSGNAVQMDRDEDESGECCRVCHLTAEKSSSVGEVIKLGCACKDDLALAHRSCAETWFKIRGDTTCEICGLTAQNIVGNSSGDDQLNDVEANSRSPICVERCWQTQPLCNTLIVCIILVLVASWLFRVTLF